MSNNEPTPAASGQPVNPGEVSPGSQTGASSQLKVLQLCHDYQGPFQSICWQYNQAFEKHDVTTVYLKGPRSQEVIRRTGGNRVLFFEQPHLRGMKIRSILALACFFRKNRFNVVIAHRYKPIFLAGLMSYFFDIRLILGVAHEHDVFSRVARSRFVTFWRTNIFIVAVSDSVFRNIAQHCPSLVADKRLATLGHSLPEVELMDHETARQNLNLPEGFLFGCVGRLVAKKNHQLLIKAFARAGLGKDCFLVFFGTGPQAKELSDLTASSGMDNQVLFKGFVDWLPDTIVHSILLFSHPEVMKHMALYCWKPCRQNCRYWRVMQRVRVRYWEMSVSGLPWMTLTVLQSNFA